MANPKFILIVEDDPIAQHGLVTILENAGYIGHAVSNGVEALDFLRNNPAPCLVLLDMLLPVLDGWGVLKAMKADSVLRTIPVVIMTVIGIASEEWAEELEAAGYLSKPIEIDALLEAVARHCS